MIYLDNASTSWPKPECVIDAMVHFVRDVGATPGRSGHRLANEAERIRFDAREAVAELFGAADPCRVVFTCNATVALNLAIRGLLLPGTHVVTTGMEHSAVMRPLRALESEGAMLSIAPCRGDGSMDAGTIEAEIRRETCLIVANGASNVCGTVLPIRDIGAIARERGVPLLVDAAQTGGVRPIDMNADHIDLLAFTGHKGLLGPSGTGGLVIGDDFDIDRLGPLVRGGTGSRSEQQVQPDFLPDKYEAGTPNTAGLAGLAASVRHVLQRGVDEIARYERTLASRLIDGLCGIPGVNVQGTRDAGHQTSVVSLTVDGMETSDIARRLDERFEILCRPGLHCAPLAHETLGTAQGGTVRLSPGLFTTERDIDAALSAVASLVEETKHA